MGNGETRNLACPYSTYPGKGRRDGVWTGNRGVTKASPASGSTKAQEGTARLGVKEGKYKTSYNNSKICPLRGALYPLYSGVFYRIVIYIAPKIIVHQEDEKVEKSREVVRLDEAHESYGGLLREAEERLESVYRLAMKGRDMVDAGYGDGIRDVPQFAILMRSSHCESYCTPPLCNLPCLPKSKYKSTADDVAAAASPTPATGVAAALAEDKPPPVQKIEAATTDKDDDDDDDEASKEVVVTVVPKSSLKKTNCEDSKNVVKGNAKWMDLLGRISLKSKNLSQENLETRMMKMATPASVSSNKHSLEIITVNSLKGKPKNKCMGQPLVVYCQ
uniref:Uncharacterized protein n=1 Tax=Oryza brachyantha TaxID=4533 RepID=J3NCV7_ORYBR